MMGAFCMTVLLVTGSRTWTPDNIPDASKIVEKVLWKWLRQRYGTRPGRDERPILRHGGAKGLDLLASDIWARWDLPTEVWRPRWAECSDLCTDSSCRKWFPGGEYCNNAGFARNIEMVDRQPYPEMCFAFIHNSSRGATQCAEYAEERGIPVRRYTA